MKRDLVYRFFRLRLSEKRQILMDLGLLVDDELRMPDFERSKLGLTRAGERGLVDEVAVMVTEYEAKENGMSGYGYCPTCGAKIVSRTRGIPSVDTCENGHRHDAIKTLKEPKAEEPKINQEAIDELRAVYDAIIGHCESIEDAEDPPSITTGNADHAAGFLRGERLAAKNIRRMAADTILGRIRNLEIK